MVYLDGILHSLAAVVGPLANRFSHMACIQLSMDKLSLVGIGFIGSSSVYGNYEWDRGTVGVITWGWWYGVLLLV